MLADLKLCLVIFCVFAYCGQAASRCKPSNRCQNKGGTCYGRKEVPAGAEKIGNCKGKCKCYKEAAITTASVRSPVCTVSGPEKGHRCQFPLKSAGKWFNDCKVRGDKSWCPTELDKSGRPKKSKWGYCGRCSEAVEMLPSFFPQCHFKLKKNSTNKGAASDFFQKWQNNIVPYQFDSSFTSIDRQTFIVATQQIEATSCVSFIESSASQYLYVTRDCACGGSCFSGGYTDGLGAASPRRLTIGSPCLDPNSQSSIGFVAHEILHALGIVHTQTRPDRNSFITVNENNIFPPTAGTKAQFERCPGCNTFGTAYDCSSIMHYRAYFFSQGSAYSMTALSPSTCDLFSSANVLTDSDKDLINKIYNCAAQTTSAPTPTPVPTPTPTPPPTTSTCLGSCGGKAPAGCWCDSSCAQYGDCCPDKEVQCSPTTPASTTTTPSPTTTTPSPTTTTPPSSSLTCNNNCGMQVSSNGITCYCDNYCIYYGDCCNDKEEFC